MAKKKKRTYQEGGLLYDPNLYQIGSLVVPALGGEQFEESVVGGGLQGGLQGAALGTQIAPGVGTVIGAGAGLVAEALGASREKSRRRRMQDIMERQRLNRIQSQSQAILSAFPSEGVEGGGNIFQDGGLLNQSGINVMNGASSVNNLAPGTLQINGNTHEQGGINIDTNLDFITDAEIEDGEVIRDNQVYSNRLKPTMDTVQSIKDDGFRVMKDDTYASIASRLSKKLGEFEDMDVVNHLSLNTRDLMMSRINNALDGLFLDQEVNKENGFI